MMDRVGARNALIVLCVIAGLTVLTVLGALILWLKGDEVPAGLLAMVTTFIGFLTGTQVSFDAKPRVDATQKAVEDATWRAQDLVQTAATSGTMALDTFNGQLVGGEPDPLDEAVVTDLHPDEFEDDTYPEVETDAPPPAKATPRKRA